MTRGCAPIVSDIIDPRRVVADVSRPSKCVVVGDPTVGICAVETRSRCTSLPLTVPVTATVPHGPASPHHWPPPEMLEPLRVRFISKKFPGIEKSSAHLPTRFVGDTGFEQALATSASNNTNL